MSDWLGFDSWLDPKLFMSLTQMMNYTYMIMGDNKVLYKSFYTLNIS